eukprot:GHVU01026923.1.p1 GENE.GHVU01026923.1~~GHVU01026923.1.p1  ORF type:complete len:111 (+),score=4.61 GHVU01026923.1:560-892(+)
MAAVAIQDANFSTFPPGGELPPDHPRLGGNLEMRSPSPSSAVVPNRYLVKESVCFVVKPIKEAARFDRISSWSRDPALQPPRPGGRHYDAGKRFMGPAGLPTALLTPQPN